MNFILASKSPRRREILENLGIPFEVVTAETDESSNVTDPCRLVELLSERKATAVWQKLTDEGRDLTDTVIIASDTVVAVDGQILGKPRDKADARRMLASLSGRAHRVISGICLMSAEKTGVAHEVTEVVFDELDDDTAEWYLASDEPYDKAGAYAIQGLASVFISGIHGCYFNVVGLPVHRLNILYYSLFGKNFFKSKKKLT